MNRGSTPIRPSAPRAHPLLRGVLALRAGYLPRGTGRLAQRSNPGSHFLVYCLKGGGWAEADGRVHPLREGDLFAAPPNANPACGAHASRAWTIYWIEAAGDDLGEFLKELGMARGAPVVQIGTDPQYARLFGEVHHALGRGKEFIHLLQASHALAYFLSLAIGHSRGGDPRPADRVQKVAHAIIYMSEHVSQPLRVSALARSAGFSPAHFSVLFKEQTGSSPRDYLHLLRIHQACSLLRDSTLTVKEIAARVGYSDALYFSRQFKAFEGQSPSDYRVSKISPS